MSSLKLNGFQITSCISFTIEIEINLFVNFYLNLNMIRLQKELIPFLFKIHNCIKLRPRGIIR